jgi:predicted membrane channel-forming protein YqfA (hemolysin III family)
MLIFGAIQLAKIYGKLPLFIVGMVMYLIGKFIYFKRMKND